MLKLKMKITRMLNVECHKKCVLNRVQYNPYGATVLNFSLYFDKVVGY